MMHSYQIDSNNSAFKMPMAPQPQPQPSQSETLLFNDILEEKALALRKNMMEFLQVLPYRKFDVEFSNFLKRTKCMMLEGQRAGANISRLTNSSQMTSINPRPSSSFNFRQPTTMSIISTNRNSSFKLPENSFQPIEPLNPFKPPGSVNLQPRVVLPRIEHSSHTSNHSPSLCATVIEVENHNSFEKTNYNRRSSQQLRPIERPQSPTPNGYSDVTMTENEAISGSNQNNTHDENSIESLLEGVGFKIIVGLPDNTKTNNSRTTKMSNASQRDENKLNVIENVIRHLSMWSVNTKLIKTQMKSTKVVVILSGILLGEDRVTVLEKRHDAGVLECRKEANLVKTRNGLYRLVGNIIGGSPNEFYQACLAVNGIPRIWKKMIQNLSGIEKGSKNLMLNFTLDSPAGPIKPKNSKAATNLNMSVTRNGTNYCKNVGVGNKKTNGKRKFSEQNETVSKTKHRKFQEQLPPLTASTPKRPGKQNIFESPSQMLKNKLHQNIQNKKHTKSSSRTLNALNDSINVTKKRQSFSKEQLNEFVKPKIPMKISLSSNNSSKRSNQVTNTSSRSSLNSSKRSNQVTNISSRSSLNSTKQSKQKSFNNSKITTTNNSSSRSTSKTSANSSVATLNSLNQSKRKSLAKLSINSSKNTLNSTAKSKQKSPNKSVSGKIVKSLKQSKQKENVTNNVSITETALIDKENKKSGKGVRPKNKNVDVDEIDDVNKNSNELKIKKKSAQSSSSAEVGLFNNIDVADYGDINDFNDIMASPSKLSAVSRGDNSRSETPPLFGNQWNSIAKSLAASEPPTPISKSTEAKALKRVKAPKITFEEEIKNNKKNNNKQSIDYKAVSKKINKMLEFGKDYDADDD